ncbi:phosphoglycerate mutase-like protein [Sporormia fimetaria CBS 119925]|uniref:Phosphoglycerate mutase-like protein n=1 Tax=Sporormia fimetaria CBS 119925 TaxID=1340428 RepID=A0A6A6V9U9_9PLEO|nr:phosphoglycerate mutase-like protein [Sporormia fimetaria CBS 119925]
MPSPTPSLSVERVLIAVAVALIAFLWHTSRQPVECPASVPEEVQHPGYSEYECPEKPHHGSWESWWHPQRIWSKPSEQGAGALTKDWNILYHLGGNGPWIEKEVNVVEGGIAPPAECRVEQVHMMSRHAERYPTLKAGTRMRSVVDKMKTGDVTFNGSLAFVHDWDLFWSDDSQLAQLTSTGPFAGRLGAFTTGVRLRTRYQHLLPKANPPSRKTKLFASDSQRVIDTARHVAAGLFGLDWQTSANVEVIPETVDRGANTLTPGETCPNYISDEEEGWAKGWKSMYDFRATYFPSIRARLSKENPRMNFDDDELYAMQEMCGFETTVRGSSKWCDVFTQQDFLNFEYARDVHHYYRAGPGTKYGAGMGWLWLNATTNLMVEGPQAGKMFFSFVHDTDMAPMLAALDIMTPEEHLPLTQIAEDRTWRKSQVSPMGGRIIFEVLSCHAETRGWLGGRDRFVRININDGITALPGCDTGPGKSCRLSAFVARVLRKGLEVGDYREMCGLDSSAPDSLTFLRQ